MHTEWPFINSQQGSLTAFMLFSKSHSGSHLPLAVAVDAAEALSCFSIY